MAKIIHVGKGSTSYKVIVSNNSLTKSNLKEATKSSRKILIVTDSGIPKAYLKSLKENLGKEKKVYVHTIPMGETSKSFEEYMKILEKLAKQNFDRSDLLIALGGGMVGDITGFSASSYLRGIDFIQIPTSLLAQVDSSVGGKTAINIKQGKNLVGAFYNPKIVLVSTSFLKSLKDSEFSSGLGEIVKYSYLGNKKIKSILKNKANKVIKRDSKIMEELVVESIKTKSRIVTSDEKENGIRAILNLGHTFGHAIEAKCGYKNIPHGQAVIYGMQIVARISFLEGLIEKEDYIEMDEILSSLNLDTNFQQFKYTEIRKYLKNDKKVSSGKLSLILLNKGLTGYKTDKFDSSNFSKAFKIN